MMCKYCVGFDDDSQTSILTCNQQAFLDTYGFDIDINGIGELTLYASIGRAEGGNIGRVKINYCPMCGRKLPE